MRVHSILARRISRGAGTTSTCSTTSVGENSLETERVGKDKGVRSVSFLGMRFFSILLYKEAGTYHFVTSYNQPVN